MAMNGNTHHSNSLSNKDKEEQSFSSDNDSPSTGDSQPEDIWSPSLRENVFSNHDLGQSWSNTPTHRDPIPETPPGQPTSHSHSPYPTRPHSMSPFRPQAHNSTFVPPTPSQNSQVLHSHANIPQFGPPTLPSLRETLASNYPLADSPHYNTTNGFVDLTADSSPPTMRHGSSSQRTNVLKRTAQSTLASPHTKRRRNAMGLPRIHSFDSASDPEPPPPVSQFVEQVDLVDEEGLKKPKDLERVLKQQRIESIRTQHEQADKPARLSNQICVICMEPMKDITATHCGHLFCHSCLMEALIAGENQEPGRSSSKCPVCRTKVARPRGNKHGQQIIPLEMKFSIRSRTREGKGKAREEG